ncbi:MAG: hypothetical protein ACI86M_002946 [Saprospiraceae bacterium]|jgi:hypothetical protein
MKKNKSVSYEKRSAASLFKAISLVKSSALMVLFLVLGGIVYISFQNSIDKALEPSPEPIKSIPHSRDANALDPNRIEKGIHVETGMVYDDNFEIVRRSCTSCHSSKLVIQNRATRDGWKQMIDWMQETQGLQDLGKYEVKILDYLEKNYSPTDVGRRQSLKVEVEDWYVIKLD